MVLCQFDGEGVGFVIVGVMLVYGGVLVSDVGDFGGWCVMWYYGDGWDVQVVGCLCYVLGMVVG